MRILFLDAYFQPEQIAFTHLENDLLEGLTKEGHVVEVICPIPTRGVSNEVAKKYKSKKSETLYGGRVRVTRFSAPREGKNPLIRAIRYFWCNLRTYQIGKRANAVDVVFANSTPPTQGLTAGIVAKKLKAPFVYSLQDIFPDSLVTTGLAEKNTVLVRLGSYLEKNTYKMCASIIVLSNSMKNNLLHKGVREEFVHVVSNWIDLDAVHQISKTENRLFDEFGISRQKYIVLYAGNFGAAQGAEIVLDAAEMLQDQTDIQFVIFGGGAGYKSAETRAKLLDNVFIHPILSQKRISEVYSMGDVALITCKKGVGKSGMPSKTWSIMACNTPIIASFDLNSDLAEIIVGSGIGCCVEPENSDLLSKSIMQHYRLHLGKESSMGRCYVEHTVSKEACVAKYIDIISNSYINYIRNNGRSNN